MQSVDKAAADKKLAFSSDTAAPQAPGQRGPQGRGGRGQGGRRPHQKSEGESSGLIESVIRISRVAKVTKGGTKLSFSALVVVGDGKGHVGYALGKAAEVAVGIKKGLNAAKKRMIEVPRRGTTIPHQVIGKWCASEVLLKPASDGTGVIACGPVRAICDGAGIKNILTKVHRSSNPMNVVKATFEGLSRLKVVKVNPDATIAAPATAAQTENKA
jgi:small subunit ribosomal protein S5